MSTDQPLPSDTTPSPPLLPCPFCGGPAHLAPIDDGSDLGAIGCASDCALAPYLTYDERTEGRAIAEWNRRAPAPSADAAVRRIEDAISEVEEFQGLSWLESSEIQSSSFDGLLEMLEEAKAALSAAPSPAPQPFVPRTPAERAANSLLCDMTGNRAWDVPCAATHLDAYARQVKEPAPQPSEVELMPLSVCMAAGFAHRVDAETLARHVRELVRDGKEARAALKETGHGG